MKTKTTRDLLTTAILGALAFLNPLAQADEIGHFVPGVPNIRDFTVPNDPGFYGIGYNYFYDTTRLNDRNGDKVDSITINPRGGTGKDVGVDVDVNLYALSPSLLWVSDYKVLGARYAAYIVPTVASASIGASLSTVNGSGVNPETSQFDFGDLFVQPVWLGWSETNADFALGYGFYAPVGKYNTQTFNLPVVGPLTAEAADNIGYGFWTHQIQGAASWYPWADKRMAVTSALTYEIHGEKRNFDITPGQNLTLNWGISQYVPLTGDQKLLLEVGPAGYSSWQVTDDHGSDARTPKVNDQVHAVGGQLGLTYVPWLLSANLHGFSEVASVGRFQGTAFGFNLAKKF
jgi:hypothetical protein